MDRKIAGKGSNANGTQVMSGPQMIQLSLDDRWLYVTTYLLCIWDKRFDLEIRINSDYMTIANREIENGGMSSGV